MNTQDAQPSPLATPLAILGLLAAVALPLPSANAHDPSPIAAADDDCEKAKVEIEIDVVTGEVFLFDPAEGNFEPAGEQIPVYFGALSSVVVVLEYTSGDWEVAITGADGRTEIHHTDDGVVRYKLAENAGKVQIVSTELGSDAGAMTTMTPVLPDIIIRPKKDCPPSP